MKISELEKQLADLKAKHGDISVRVQTLTHLWAPEPEIRSSGSDKYVLLNP